MGLWSCWSVVRHGEASGTSVGYLVSPTALISTEVSQQQLNWLPSHLPYIIMFPNGSILMTLMAVGKRPPQATMHLDEPDHKALQLAGDVLQVAVTASWFVFARHCLVGEFDQSLMTPGCCPGQTHLHKVEVYLCKFRSLMVRQLFTILFPVSKQTTC